MRSLSTGAVVLVIFAAACSQRSDSTVTLGEDLKKDLAAASISTGALATPPANFERLRFVSSVEMSRATEKAPRPKKSTHHDHMAPASNDGPESNGAASEEVLTVASEAPSPVETTASVPLPPEPMIEEPTRGNGTWSGRTPSAEGRGQGVGRSIGNVLGAIFSNAVIRGGIADDDKCDPRTDRRRPITYAMPIVSAAAGGGFHRHVYR